MKMNVLHFDFGLIQNLQFSISGTPLLRLGGASGALLTAVVS